MLKDLQNLVRPPNRAGCMENRDLMIQTTSVFGTTGSTFGSTGCQAIGLKYQTPNFQQQQLQSSQSPNSRRTSSIKK